MTQHVAGETGALRIRLALSLVDEHRSRQREVFPAVKWIVGEEYPALLSDSKGSEALTAGAVTGGDLRMGSMAVAGGSHGPANRAGDWLSESHYAIVLHSSS